MTRQRHCDGKRRSNAEIVRLIQKKIEDEDDDENDWGGNQPKGEPSIVAFLLLRDVKGRLMV